ncbi:Solute carrier organic anion transporter family member 5A1 [Nymphon striatum]|nr:Solute carrier organic anion transporter family member 5A1 [Nymphon striatum]
MIDNNASEEEAVKCGMFGFRPKWLQKLAHPVTFLITFCCLSLVQGAYWTYFIGVITTIEKRYAFESKTTGLILIADNLSPILTSFVIGFFGGRGNRPLWLGVGMLISGISALLSAMPYWIYGPPSFPVGGLNGNTEEAFQLCSPTINGSDIFCQQDERKDITAPAVLILFLGNFINGIGSTSFYVIGIMSSVRLFGPTLGFLLSASLLKHFEDPSAFPKDVLKVMKNKLLLCTALGHCFYFMAALGFFQYMPKYVESQFKKSASDSNYISENEACVPPLRATQASDVIGLMALRSCKQVRGQTRVNNTMIESESDFSDPEIEEFRNLRLRGRPQGYKNSIVIRPIPSRFSRIVNQMEIFISGLCPTTCSGLLPYMIIIVITKAFGSTSKVGTIIVALRSVEVHDKSLALSVITAFTNTIANIPSPLIFGALVDAACKIWKISCDARGNCWVYDSVNFRHYLHGATASMYFIAMIFDMMMCYYSKNLDNLYDDEKEETPDENTQKSEVSTL